MLQYNWIATFYKICSVIELKDQNTAFPRFWATKNTYTGKLFEFRQNTSLILFHITFICFGHFFIHGSYIQSMMQEITEVNGSEINTTNKDNF